MIKNSLGKIGRIGEILNAPMIAATGALADGSFTKISTFLIPKGSWNIGYNVHVNHRHSAGVVVYCVAGFWTIDDTNWTSILPKSKTVSTAGDFSFPNDCGQSLTTNFPLILKADTIFYLKAFVQGSTYDLPMVDTTNFHAISYLYAVRLDY
jgi:hypothetical protein